MRNSKGKRRLLLSLLLGGLWVWALGALFVDNILISTIPTFRDCFPLKRLLETLGILVALAGVAGYMTRIVPQTLFRRRMFLKNVFLTSAILVVLLLGFSVCGRQGICGNSFSWHFILAARSLSMSTTAGWPCAVGPPVSLTAGTITRVRLWVAYHTRLLKDDYWIHHPVPGSRKQGCYVEETNRWSDRKAEPNGNRDSGISISRTYFWTLPEDIPTNRALWLALSFWKIEENEFNLLPVVFSDYPLLGDTHVILDELVLPETGEK